ncbi:MAG: type II toxin-antitoxin system RelE/ParE family toxin [Rhodothermia bacterium]
MEVKWTENGQSDLTRLYDFLAPLNRDAALRIAKAIVAAAARLVENPRLGEQLFEFEPREVRRIVVGRYELRYEIQGPVVYILRIWHTREDR